ncbi:hypothetical protein C0431_12235 [bacterium]|nr:hypothetical protein [bacterium]
MTWEEREWANRYAVYRIERGKRVLLTSTSKMTFTYDRRAREAMPMYEVVAERIGDIEFEDMAFALVQDEERDAQDIAIRMQSKKGDWRGHESIGCDLHQFVGQPNTALTAAEIVDAVTDGVTAEGRFDEIEVRVVPTAIDRVSVYAFNGEAYAKEDVAL